MTKTSDLFYKIVNIIYTITCTVPNKFIVIIVSVLFMFLFSTLLFCTLSPIGALPPSALSLEKVDTLQAACIGYLNIGPNHVTYLKLF